MHTPPITGQNGIVVTDAAEATRVGVEVLRAGGNAVDAAVAAAFALAVVYPEAGNIGGGGFMIVHGAGGTVGALDFRETAPGLASRDMFLGEDGEVTEHSVTGHLASGVPGSVAGLWQAHQRFGRLPWTELVAPAIRLAANGFPVDARFAASVRAQQRRLERFRASAALFLPGGRPLVEGETWRNPELAAVLERVAERGEAGFYEGETAELIVAEMRRNGGLISHDDLASYRAVWREPVTFTYRDHTIVSMPPPSSGGVTLAMIANQLQAYELAGHGWNSATTMHLMTEAMRRAFADRNAYLADPDFSPVPTERLVSADHAAARRASISPDRATPSEVVTPAGAPGGPPEGNNTTHIVVADSSGTVVSLTTTINGLYGSGVTVTGAGFVLNNEMDDFTAKPGAPNMFGLIQGEMNVIEPGKRMLSAMTPTIVLAPDGRPLIATGARGGPRIITAVFQVLSNLIDHGMDPGTAVAAPRI
ncbi:MAG TPA: gamma-glutamyltransferase, partial [Longimicrobiales bacterium]|nr:gamma-glutamyltransferase [Longimicrobiales bacterium]